MAQPEPPALLPLAAMLEPMLARIAAVDTSEAAPAEAVGAIAAAAIRAPGPVPAQALALRAGFAVDSAAIAGASAYEPIPLVAPPVPLLPGEPLPPGCDAVLPADAVRLEDGHAEALAAAFPGENARLAGEDLPAGATIVPAGMRIGPREALAAAQAGLIRLPIRRPRLRIEGADRAEPGLPALIAALAGGLGCRVTEEAPEARIRFDDAGEAPRLAVNGGIPAGLILTAEGLPVLSLARRFDAALAGFLALGLPVLAARAGLAPPAATLPLLAKVSSAIGMSETILLGHAGAGWQPLARGAIPLQALLAADAVAIAPAMLEGYPVGEPLAAIRLGALLGK